MQRIHLKAGLLAMMLSSLVISTGHAADQTPVNPAWQKLDPAWAKVGAQVATLLGKDGQKVFIDLAYSSVVVEMCQGFTLDDTRFQNGFAIIETEHYKTLTPEQQREFERNVSVYYGTYRGLLTAEGLLDTPAFCAGADALRRAGQIPFWKPV